MINQKIYTTKQELVSSFVEMEDFIPKKGHIVYRQTMLSCTKHGGQRILRGGFNRYHIDDR